MSETLEELKERKQRLLNRQQSHEEIEKIGRERKELKKEVRELEHPRQTAFGKFIGRGAKAIGKGTIKIARGSAVFIEKATRPTPKQRQQIRTVKRNKRRLKVRPVQKRVQRDDGGFSFF